ncbi:hypothetical protein BDP27DRAFT_1336305 [Rhodocollybia butyracea]|uniref:Uncharacterized protein n=1 Tax=Rhodocollybia butyracea TaxID=206335 RepID=A0A9P5U2G8_9AGAR|nr:hypothetical protein BDP27DRAFT_1336305 [Rhodocollybia butyracea]
MIERIDAAAFILQETQQCPMRANQRGGELANLIILDDNNGQQKFWIAAEKDLRNTRRGFTQSFLAQVLLAFLAYLISFIAAVQESLGNPEVGLQFASSTVWSWMFPIVFGYVRVGSQCKVGTIKKALTDHKFIPSRNIAGNTELTAQIGFRPSTWAASVRCHRNPLQQQARAALLVLGQSLPRLYQMICTIHQYPPLTWWGFDVRGDERTEGPVFNYARILTWFTFAGHVHAGFNSAVASLQTIDMVQPLTTHDAAALCCLEQDLKAFMPFSTLRKHPQVIHHMLQAALVALFLQWGTTGAAIFVAYRTPAIGLGCRSGSYLIYGIAATVSWLMLVFSNLVSHKIMQRLETQPDTQSTRGLGRLAVITRLTGKAIAIVNAGWLIASSVMEDIGAFQNCWCQTDAFQFHEHGWTAVFKSASDLRNAAGGIWIGGFIWSMAVCIVVAVVFAYQVNGERNTLD